MHTLSAIQTATESFAKRRREALDYAATIEAEVQAVRDNHEAALIKKVKAMVADHETLHTLIAASEGLFTKPKSLVFDGIKVGFQVGKITIDIDDKAELVRVLQALVETEDDAEDVANYQACLRTTVTPHEPSLLKLPPHHLIQLPLTVKPASNDVLIKPVDTDTTKAVDALIKAVQADIADGTS
jgi:hypothetical protein